MIDLYSYTESGQTEKAIQALPDFSLASKESQKAKATGTDAIYLDTLGIQNQNEPQTTGISFKGVTQQEWSTKARK